MAHESGLNDPHPNHVLDELGFRFDPNNLYQQTANAMLDAAEILDLPHHLRLILAQPKTEIMCHFPVSGRLTSCSRSSSAVAPPTRRRGRACRSCRITRANSHSSAPRYPRALVFGCACI